MIDSLLDPESPGLLASAEDEKSRRALCIIRHILYIGNPYICRLYNCCRLSRCEIETGRKDPYTEAEDRSHRKRKNQVDLGPIKRLI